MSTPSPTRAPANILEALQQQGHSVFIDRTLAVDQPWAKEIESEVRNSDCLIVFLTAQSSQSEMVQGEIEIAREQAAKAAGKPRGLPVRVAYAGPLPYPLNAWLDPIQYALWHTKDRRRYRSVLPDQVQGDGSVMGGGAVLEEVDALPRA